MTKATGLTFNNTYAKLPAVFYSRVAPTSVTRPALIQANPKLARFLGASFEGLQSPEGIAALAGNRTPEGAEPLAQAYSGHQFGHFNPQLGDGRAILLGEVRGQDGNLWDIQLKGAGITPWSRQGDGRAAIGPVVREYIVSEAMQALGVKTTRSLAAVATGEQVLRERPLPGAILTRVARCHVRIGTFEYFRGQADTPSIKTLADYVINRLYPTAAENDKPYLTLLEQVIEAQARLIASWMHLGFIHGVMNTDNMAISGETIDYGPCAFMDAFEVNKVFSSIDTGGRYAYANQSHIGLWNLTRFAECLLPLLATDTDAAVAAAEGALEKYSSRFRHYWLSGMREKLGFEAEQDDDEQYIQDLFNAMQNNAADFTLTFRLLSDAADGSHPAPLLALFKTAPEEIENWLENWHRRIGQQASSPEAVKSGMNRKNPLYIPRNHQVEAAIQAAQTGDYEPMHKLNEVLQNPFNEQPGAERFTLPPEPHEEVSKTFCGT